MTIVKFLKKRLSSCHFLHSTAYIHYLYKVTRRFLFTFVPYSMFVRIIERSVEGLILGRAQLQIPLRVEDISDEAFCGLPQPLQRTN
jgi:hypothetical protein